MRGNHIAVKELDGLSPALVAMAGSPWSRLVAHVARQASGIHLVYGELGCGAPFVAEQLVQVALEAGHRVAAQDLELRNPSNWRRAVQLSRCGAVVVVRLHAPSLAVLQHKYQALLRATPADLAELRSQVEVVRAHPRMPVPDLGSLQLLEGPELRLPRGPLSTDFAIPR